MKPLTMKQSQRMEKKKKKMAAYLEIAKLNDKDREVKESKLRAREESTAESSDSDQSFTEKMPPGEPSRKRARKHELVHSNPSQNDAMETITGATDDPEPIEADPSTFNSQLTPNQLSFGPKLREPFSPEDLAELRRQLRERKRFLKNLPLIRLKETGEMASIDLSEDDRTPLFLSDIQHLLLYSAIGNNAPYNPLAWCQLEKPKNISQIVFLMVEGVSLYDFRAYENCFPTLSGCFTTKLEVITPSAYNGNFIEELSLVPLTHAKEVKLLKQYKTIENAMRADGDIHKVLRAMFPVMETDMTGAVKSNEGFSGTVLQRPPHKTEEVIGDVAPQWQSPESEEENTGVMPQWQSLSRYDQFPRTQLIMSVAQLIDQCFPIPVKGPLKRKYMNYVLTKDMYNEVTPDSPMFALDCEMCLTTARILELTRISIVDEQLNCVYDTLVLPYNKIINYLTQYSGITPKMLMNVTKRLEDVQEDIRQLLPTDAILIGQSLNGDLHALRMMHPYVIDTSVIFNVTGDYKRKSKLSVLSMKFLGEEIQNSMEGHCSTEDSEACMKLVQLKLANSLAFGDTILAYRTHEYKSITQKMVIPSPKHMVIPSPKPMVIPSPKPMETPSPKPMETPSSPDTMKAWNEASALLDQDMHYQEHARLDQEHLASSMFSYFKNHDKSVAIVSTREVVDAYSVWINSRLPPSRKKGKKAIECVPASTMENVVSKMGTVQGKHSLTLGHLVYDPEELDKVRNKEDVFREIDSWCEELWEKVSTNGLCLIMFGGRPGGANGVCFMKLKRCVSGYDHHRTPWLSRPN